MNHLTISPIGKPFASEPLTPPHVAETLKHVTETLKTSHVAETLKPPRSAPSIASRRYSIAYAYAYAYALALALALALTFALDNAAPSPGRFRRYY
ncbi:hypothetical protein B0H11DRAFT_2223604 [Mycena galericulata]|nr:hypothetical protein B0H11DRAFT_2223604 [Mycena galericulata]